MRIVKDHPAQVRFDDAIPLDVESSAALDDAGRAVLAREIEREIRGQLQVRVAVSVLPAHTLPRGTYKNALVVVRDGAGKGAP
jgi:hypothetical protein